MTRKRVKFGLALLGLLMAFLMGLLALMFVPTLASADKGSGTAWEDGHGQSGNPAYFDQADRDHTGSSGSDHRGSNPPHGDVGPCAGAPNACEAWNGQGDDAGHYAEGPNSGGQNFGGRGGNGDPGHNTDSGNQPHGGQGGQPGPFAGWLPSGGLPGGGGTDATKTCTKDNSKSDKSDTDSDKDTGKKTCDKSGDGQSNTSENQPGDPSGDPGANDPTDNTSGDFSSGFFDAMPTNNLDFSGGDNPPDPNCFPFGDVCGPQNDNPPNAPLTDSPNQIPEPFTLSLFAVGLTGAAALRRNRRKTIARPPAG